MSVLEEFIRVVLNVESGDNPLKVHSNFMDKISDHDELMADDVNASEIFHRDTLRVEFFAHIFLSIS